MALVGGLVLAMAGTCDTGSTAPDTCVAATALTLGATTSGATAEGDCNFNGDAGDSYTLTLTAQTTVKFAVTSAAGVKLRVRSASSHDTTQTVAADAPTAASFNSYVVLPAGTFTVDITETGGFGNYTVTPTAVTPPLPGGCVTSSTAGHMSAVVGITVDGAISTADCLGSNNQYYVDSYDVYMTGVQARTIAVTGSIGTTVEVHADGGTLLSNKSLNTAGTNSLGFTPSSTGRYHIAIIGIPALATGTYTLKIQ